HMTHTGIDYSGGTMSLGDRIDVAGAVGADILISLHCNAAENPEANGAEVYVSHSRYDDRFNRECTKLATSILKQFRDMGLNIRGVKNRLSDGSRVYYHDDGTQEVGDYYAVIGGVIKKYGIPGILVEHAFMKGDEALLSSADNLRALGIADATAIAEYYGLKLKTDGPSYPIDEAPEAVFVTDQDILSASDVSEMIVNLPQDTSMMNYEQVIGIRDKYEALTYEGKTLVDDELTDILYRALITFDYRTHPVRIIAKEESALTVNRINHTISGLDLATATLSGTNVASLLESVSVYVDPENVGAEQLDVSSAYIIATDEAGGHMDIGRQVGTGCKLQLWNSGVLLDELTVVIACDISGDGAVDSLDLQLLEEYLENGKVLSEAALYAADVNADGRVNDRDATEIVYKIAENE
ncbi:MAG: N-acetylmuramoyl-L-alanine amidase, partial [Clostridia bacterium]|nr:N-acetylmuramoyl-L-alanine amidase [Clostridia bacterium]